MVRLNRPSQLQVIIRQQIGLRFANRLRRRDPEQAERITLNDPAQVLPRNGRQAGAERELVDAVERLDAGRGRSVREIAAEKELVHHTILVGRQQRVKRLPRSVQQSRNVRENVEELFRIARLQSHHVFARRY